MANDEWRDDARCRGTDIEVFYSEDPGLQAQALALCASCPVRLPCLESAMALREVFGVWGGTAEGQRRRAFRHAGRGSRTAARLQAQQSDTAA